MKPEHFLFLDNLRKSGATNMFGAAAYLAPRFNLSEKEARDILAAWMETFDGVSSPEDRIKEYQEAHKHEPRPSL